MWPSDPGTLGSAIDATPINMADNPALQALVEGVVVHEPFDAAAGARGTTRAHRRRHGLRDGRRTTKLTVWLCRLRS
jgi:IS5 family transposase